MIPDYKNIKKVLSSPNIEEYYIETQKAIPQLLQRIAWLEDQITSMWHDPGTIPDLHLHEVLGMTRNEYQEWVTNNYP